MRVGNSARPGGIIGVSFDFLQYKGILCVLIRIASVFERLKFYCSFYDNLVAPYLVADKLSLTSVSRVLQS